MFKTFSSAYVYNDYARSLEGFELCLLMQSLMVMTWAKKRMANEKTTGSWNVCLCMITF